MSSESVIPKVGYLLRELIRCSGYLDYHIQYGLDPDLLDLANEEKSREGQFSVLLEKVEAQCAIVIEQECGSKWLQLVQAQWGLTKSALQKIAQQVDTSWLTCEQGAAIFFQYVTVPLMWMLLRMTSRLMFGPDLNPQGWKSPFSFWAKMVEKRYGFSHEALVRHMAAIANVDRKTVNRWLKGGKMSEIGWPYRTKTIALLNALGAKKVAREDVDNITAWLVLAVAFHELSPEQRLGEQTATAAAFDGSWNPEKFHRAIAELTTKQGKTPLQHELRRAQKELEKLFSVRPVDEAAIRQILADMQARIDLDPSGRETSGQHLHDRYAARLAGMLGQREEATRLYRQAFDSAWWRAGPTLMQIGRETLVYFIGSEQQELAQMMWDKAHLIGARQYYMHEMSDFERQRLVLEYERLFSDKQPLCNESPATDYGVELQAPLTVAEDTVRAPKERTTTQYTALMKAVQFGTPAEVKDLIIAGADPDEMMVGTNESPLYFALQRTLAQGDPAILDYLIGLKINRKTINRAVLPKRETPLQLAIKLGHARAVSRLIKLGADVERSCGNCPSALWYALMVFDYIKRQGRSDHVGGYEKPCHFLTKVVRRIMQVGEKDEGETPTVMGAIVGNHKEPLDGYRMLISVLLENGADPNRQYRCDPERVGEWTPTLFAARIGDLEVFRLMLDFEGDPRQVIEGDGMQSQRIDALRIAIDYGHPEIAALLK